MTIARRRVGALDAIAQLPTAPALRPGTPPLGVPVPFSDEPAPEAVTPPGRLRRCTFRRIDRVSALPGRSERSSYEVMCLYGSAEPLALGYIDEARPVCEACTAFGIFRPDED